MNEKICQGPTNHESVFSFTSKIQKMVEPLAKQKTKETVQDTFEDN